MTTTPPLDGRASPTLQQNGEPEPEPEPEPDPMVPEQEVVLEGEELFMMISSEEEEEFRKRMKEMENNLQTRRDNFNKWHDGITRRRMFAYSRLRKLQEAGQQRGVFLEEISAYVASAKSKSKVNKDDRKLKASQSSKKDRNILSVDSQQQRQQQPEETVKPLLRS